MQTGVRANLEAVQKRIEKAAKRVDRDSSEIKLVAVSKTHPVSVLREAITAGAVILGENKVQEAEGKILELGRRAAEWHLIGHLQSNKVRKVVQLFDVIQSVDSLELGTRLERICNEEGRDELIIFVEVDLAGEGSKSGIAEKDLPELVEFLKSCKHLKFNGLMLLPPYFDDAEKTRPFFKRLRKLRDQLAAEKAFANGVGELSMGMSHDCSRRHRNFREKRISPRIDIDQRGFVCDLSA
jgi:PLP dependent protein